jgi:TPR repeat protein
MLLIMLSNLLQKHPGALFLVGAMYLVGNHVNKDPKAAAWCFHKAAEQVGGNIFPRYSRACWQLHNWSLMMMPIS